MGRGEWSRKSSRAWECTSWTGPACPAMEMPAGVMQVKRDQRPRTAFWVWLGGRRKFER